MLVWRALDGGLSARPWFCRHGLLRGWSLCWHCRVSFVITCWLVTAPLCSEAVLLPGGPPRYRPLLEDSSQGCADRGPSLLFWLRSFFGVFLWGEGGNPRPFIFLLSFVPVWYFVVAVFLVSLFAVVYGCGLSSFVVWSASYRAVLCTPLRYSSTSSGWQGATPVSATSVQVPWKF